MNFENQEKISYPEELEKTLEAKGLIDLLENDFNKYLQEESGIEIRSELTVLKLIKLYIYKNREKIKSITEGSVLSGFDCLTLSIITCLLANRKGYQIKIGRPDKIIKHFHSLLVRSNGEMFKIAGKDTNYSAKVMEAGDIIDRLKYIKPIINTVDLIKKSFKNRA